MKKFISLLLAVCGIAVAAFSQTRYTSVVYDENTYGISNAYHCAVRHWQGTFSVAASNLGQGKVAFSLIDHTDFDNIYMGTPPSPNITGRYSVFQDNVDFPKLYINDLYVVDNYAFFCGEIDGCAIYGYFDINNLLGTSLNLNLYKLTPSLTYTPPISLKKLVAYNMGGGIYDVVSFGDEKKETELYYSSTIIVEINNATNISPYIQALYIPSSPTPFPKKVFYDDIILTDSYVVILGHDLNFITASCGCGYPLFSFGNRGNVVTDIYSFGSYYLPVAWEANDKVAGVALQDDKFAIAYVNDHGSGNYYTRLRVIDIPTMNNTYSQEFKKQEKEYPIEMIYLSGLKSIEILQRVTDSSNFIQMFPFVSVPYTTTMLTPNNHEFKSLNAIDGHRFISARNSTVYLEDRTASIPHSSPSCPTNNRLKVDTIANLMPTNTLFGINETWNISPILNYSDVKPTNFKGCFSFE